MPGEPPVFWFDVGSPYAYLAAARIDALLPGPARWQPLLLGGIFKATGRDSWARGPGREEGIREVERRATEYGLPPLRWPDPWPGDGLQAMRAATWAQREGFGVEFARAAFEAAFVQGRDLSLLEEVMDVARACDADPGALREAVGDPDVKARLRAATDDALARGVTGVPTVLVGDALFWGDDRLEEAAAATEAA